MSCPDLQKKILADQERIRKTNARQIAWRYGMGSNKPEDVIDRLVHQHGYTPDYANFVMNAGVGEKTETAKAMEKSDDLANNAQNFKDQNAGQDGKVAWDKIKTNANTLRQKVYDSVERSFNASQKTFNSVLKGMIKNFAGENEYMSLGKGVFAGRLVRRIVSGEVSNLYKQFKEQSNSTLSQVDFDEGLNALAGMRGKDIPKFISEMRDKIAQNIEKKPILKLLSKKLDLAEELNKSQAVNDYRKEVYRKLDVVRGIAFEGEKGHENYFHNRIMMEQHQDLWDQMLNPNRTSESRIYESKKYDTAMEAELAGFRPASDSFVENEGRYWSSVANKLRKERFRDTIRENAELPNENPNKAMVETYADHAEPAFFTKPEDAKNWQTPKTADGRYYKEMENLGHQFDGIYVHPDMYRWQEKVFRHVDVDGAAGKILRGMKSWRNMNMSFSAIPHAWSLWKKVNYLGTRYLNPGEALALKDGLGVWGIIQEGHAALAPESAKFATTLRFLKNGLGLDTVDMTRNAAFNRKYLESGERTFTGNKTLQRVLPEGLQTGVATLGDTISKITNWQHEMLFDKARTGVKIGLAHRIHASEYFTKLVEESGGDQDVAMAKVSKMLNDHFGGQNLEMIGRSRLVQTVLQSVLISPEWTEAKIKRAYGTVMDIDPSVRKAYTASVAAEIGSWMLLRFAIQGVVSGTTGNQRSFNEQTQDIWDGKFAAVYLGKTREKHPHDLFANYGLSENQDWRLLILGAKGMYESGVPFTGGWTPTAPLKEVVKEVGHKLSPPLKAAIETMTETKDQADKETGLAPLITPLLPFSAQQASDALQGKMGEPALPMAAGVAASGMVGVPVERYREQDKKKKKLGMKK